MKKKLRYQFFVLKWQNGRPKQTVFTAIAVKGVESSRAPAKKEDSVDVKTIKAVSIRRRFDVTLLIGVPRHDRFCVGIEAHRATWIIMLRDFAFTFNSSEQWVVCSSGVRRSFHSGLALRYFYRNCDLNILWPQCVSFS